MRRARHSVCPRGGAVFSAPSAHNRDQAFYTLGVTRKRFRSEWGRPRSALIPGDEKKKRERESGANKEAGDGRRAGCLVLPLAAPLPLLLPLPLPLFGCALQSST